jgi:hypothetical protein
MEKVRGACYVHVLPDAVLTGTAFGDGDNLRMHCRKPGRHGIRRRADYHVYIGFLSGFKRAADMGEIEHPFFRFRCRPGGFGNPYDVYPRLLHHLHVRADPFIGHVFVVIRHAVQ